MYSVYSEVSNSTNSNSNSGTYDTKDDNGPAVVQLSCTALRIIARSCASFVRSLDLHNINTDKGLKKAKSLKKTGMEQKWILKSAVFSSVGQTASQLWSTLSI